MIRVRRGRERGKEKRNAAKKGTKIKCPDERWQIWEGHERLRRVASRMLAMTKKRIRRIVPRSAAEVGHGIEGRKHDDDVSGRCNGVHL